MGAVTKEFKNKKDYRVESPQSFYVVHMEAVRKKRPFFKRAFIEP